MKGLLIKDFRLLKGQKTFFGSVLVMLLLFMTAYSQYSFVIAYITMMFGVIAVSTIGFDDQDNGLGYLFTLPISRREYVLEKYLLSVMTTIPGIVLVCVLSLVVSRVRKADLSVEEAVTAAAVSFLMVTLMMSILIPVQLKFGSDKSRFAIMILFGGGSLTVYAGMKVCDTFGIDYMAAFEKLANLSPAVILTGLALICAVLMGISYLFSCRFIVAREF